MKELTITSDLCHLLVLYRDCCGSHYIPNNRAHVWYAYMHALSINCVPCSNGEYKLLQNEPAEKLMTDHDFKPTEIKHGPAYCVICSKKVRGNSRIANLLNIIICSSGVTKC